MGAASVGLPPAEPRDASTGRAAAARRGFVGTPAPGGALLELVAVRHDYPSPAGGRFAAVEEVSLWVQAGELVAVIGPSGCGKSTLIRIAAGLVRPSAGSVRFMGRDPASAKGPPEIGVVFQEPGLLPWRTALGNVALAGEVAGAGRRERLARAREVLAAVGLAGFEDYVPSQLSGGMKQRASIARALMLGPQLLLLDEPFGALDQMTRERLQGDFASAWVSAGLAAVLVTHDVDEAVFLADRILVLSRAPARVAAEIPVTTPRPRPESFRSSARFFEAGCAVRDALRAASRGGALGDAAP